MTNMSETQKAIYSKKAKYKFRENAKVNIFVATANSLPKNQNILTMIQWKKL
jgi:hypothetical protein